MRQVLLVIIVVNVTLVHREHHVGQAVVRETIVQGQLITTIQVLVRSTVIQMKSVHHHAHAAQHHIITMRDAAHAAILQEDALDAIGHTLPIARRLDADRHTLFMIPHAVQAVYVQRHLQSTSDLAHMKMHAGSITVPEKYMLKKYQAMDTHATAL